MPCEPGQRGWTGVHPPTSPNPTPCVHLREALSWLRAEFDGEMAFETAWSACVAVVLEDCRGGAERESWERVFRETEPDWRSAYQRERRPRDRRFCELRPPE